MSWLDGYKTYIGGVGMILWGVSDVLISIYENTTIDWNVTLNKVFAGWLIIGGRNAIEKIVK